MNADLIFLHWCLIQTCLPDSIPFDNVDPNQLVYIEKEEIQIPFEATLLHSLKIINVQQLLFVGENSICWLNSANYPHCQKSVLDSSFSVPSAVLRAPSNSQQSYFDKL